MIDAKTAFVKARNHHFNIIEEKYGDIMRDIFKTIFDLSSRGVFSTKMVLRSSASREDIAAILAYFKELGYTVRFHQSERTIWIYWSEHYEKKYVYGEIPNAYFGNADY